MNWDLYAWLKRGKRRQEVLKLLNNADKPLTTKDVKTKLKIAISQASATLNELYKQKLIQCLNPSDKIGRLYRITKEGKEMLNEI